MAALLIWQGSNAAFSAVTDNSDDAWAAGTLALTNSAGAVFTGILGGMPDSYAAAAGTAIAGGTQRVVYRIGWTVNAGADNSVQGSSAIADLVWEIN